MKLHWSKLSLVFLFVSSTVGAESLSDVYRLALANDLEIVKAEADAAAITAQYAQARSNLLPHVGVKGSYTTDRLINQSEHQQFQLPDYLPKKIPTPDLDIFGLTIPSFVTIDRDKMNKKLTNLPKNNFNSFKANAVASVGVGLHHELFNLKAWRGLSLADKAITVANTGYSATKQGLILRTIDAYIKVLQATEELDSIIAEREALEAQSKKSNNEYRAGMEIRAVASFAEAELQGVIAKEIVARNNLSNIINNLSLIINTPINKINGLDVNSFNTYDNTRSVQDIIGVAEQKNLMLHYNKMLNILAKDKIKLASADHYPTLSLDASVARAKVSGRKLAEMPYDNPIDRASIGVNLNIPIYSGGATSAKVTQQQKEYASSNSHYQLVYRQLVNDIHSTVNSLTATEHAINAYTKYHTAAQNALKAMQNSYRAGTSTVDELLTRIKSTYEAQRKLSEARYNNILLQLKLKLLEGTLQEDDIKQINQLFNKTIDLTQYFTE